MTDQEMISAVLLDPARTRRVVEAAIVALKALQHGERTPDGDSAAMSARTILSESFVDHDAIRAAFT